MTEERKDQSPKWAVRIHQGVYCKSVHAQFARGWGFRPAQGDVRAVRDLDQFPTPGRSTTGRRETTQFWPDAILRKGVPAQTLQSVIFDGCLEIV